MLLYQGKHMHRSALELLVARLDAANVALDDAAHSQVGDASLAVAAANEALVAYMCKLGGEDTALLLEFMEPLMENAHGPEDMALIMKVFTAPRGAGVTQLNPDEVLAFLRSDGDGRFHGIDQTVLTAKYLEFLVYETTYSTPSHHDELVALYLKKALPLAKTGRGASSPAASSRNASSHKDSTSKKSKHSRHKASPSAAGSAASKSTSASKVPIRPGFLVADSDSDSDDMSLALRLRQSSKPREGLQCCYDAGLGFRFGF
jgi:hypothetical protein